MRCGVVHTERVKAASKLHKRVTDVSEVRYMSMKLQFALTYQLRAVLVSASDDKIVEQDLHSR